MPENSYSAKLYQERKNHRPTRRFPRRTSNLARNLIHTVQLDPPLPEPAVLHAVHDPPDGGTTKLWPHEVEEPACGD